MGDLLSTAGGSGVVKSRSTDLGTMKELADHMQVGPLDFVLHGRFPDPIPLAFRLLGSRHVVLAHKYRKGV